ncbi:MAG: type IV pili twitching motility protein PilT [Myxococcales bacterium]|nr:type IV pili twitching motility protein PilT [Myxococcales bacterium]
MNLDKILEFGLKKGASDLHLRVNAPPMLRLQGKLQPIANIPALNIEQLNTLLDQCLSPQQKETLAVRHEIDLAYAIPGKSRFRVNIFYQRGSLAAAFRIIAANIRNLKELQLPASVQTIAEEQRGLVLVTGATGSGKSSTLAAILDYINEPRQCHILTIEDPIEYVFKDKNSHINQRELGLDSTSYADALRAALRQDPDVIFVGEMRDRDSINMALMAAETGHLVLSTLHTVDATETINRIISTFDMHEQEQIRAMLGSVLRGVISQRMLKRSDGNERIVAVEILRNTKQIQSLIRDPQRTHEISEAIAKGHVSYGMQTFDQSLMKLLKGHIISHDEAVKNATKPDNFNLRLGGISSLSDGDWGDFDLSQGNGVVAGASSTPSLDTTNDEFDLDSASDRPRPAGKRQFERF